MANIKGDKEYMAEILWGTRSDDTFNITSMGPEYAIGESGVDTARFDLSLNECLYANYFADEAIAVIVTDNGGDYAITFLDGIELLEFEDITLNLTDLDLFPDAEVDEDNPSELYGWDLDEVVKATDLDRDPRENRSEQLDSEGDSLFIPGEGNSLLSGNKRDWEVALIPAFTVDGDFETSGQQAIFDNLKADLSEAGFTITGEFVDSYISIDDNIWYDDDDREWNYQEPYYLKNLAGRDNNNSSGGHYGSNSYENSDEILWGTRGDDTFNITSTGPEYAIGESGVDTARFDLSLNECLYANYFADEAIAVIVTDNGGDYAITFLDGIELLEFEDITLNLTDLDLFPDAEVDEDNPSELYGWDLDEVVKATDLDRDPRENRSEQLDSEGDSLFIPGEGNSLLSGNKRDWEVALIPAFTVDGDFETSGQQAIFDNLKADLSEAGFTITGEFVDSYISIDDNIWYDDDDREWNSSEPYYLKEFSRIGGNNNSGDPSDFDDNDDYSSQQEQIAESFAPQLITASLSGNVINLQFDSELKSTNPSASKFTITASGKPIGVIAALTYASEGLVKIELDKNIQINKTVELEYLDLIRDQEIGVIESVDGEDVASFTTDVSNRTVDNLSPLLVEASAEDISVQLRFDEALDQSSNPDVKAWQLHENGKKVKIQSTEVISETLIELVLSKSIKYGSEISLSYNDPSKDQDKGVVQDQWGNDVESFKKINVLNDTEPMAEPFNYSMLEVDGGQLIISFDKELADTSPAKNSFRVYVNQKINKVKQADVFTEERSVILTLATPVRFDDSLTLSYTDADGDNSRNVVEDEYGNDLQGFMQVPVKNNTLKETSLAFQSAECSGDIIEIFFNEEIAETIASVKRFKIKADGKKQKILSVSTTPDEGLVTLKLKKIIEPGKDIILDYKDLIGDQKRGVVEDKDGNDMMSYNGVEVMNESSDDIPPQLIDAFVEIDASAGMNQLTIQFDEIISGGKLTKNRFKVKIDRLKAKVTSAVIDDEESVVILDLKPKAGIEADSVVLLSYTDPKNDQANKVVQDIFGNDLQSFANFITEVV